MKFHVPKARIYNERKTTYYNKRCRLIYFNENSLRELKKMSYTINDVQSRGEQKNQKTEKTEKKNQKN
jgi:hypothetical protein